MGLGYNLVMDKRFIELDYGLYVYVINVQIINVARVGLYIAGLGYNTWLNKCS